MADCHRGCIGRRVCRVGTRIDYMRAYRAQNPEKPEVSARRNLRRWRRRLAFSIVSKTHQIAEMEAQLLLSRTEVASHG